MPAPVHPATVLIGTWEGAGAGEYPTIEPFAYTEVVTFTRPVAAPRGAGPDGDAPPRPFLVYEQRTWDRSDGRPLHVELGYWRLLPPEGLEVVIAQPTGITEVLVGSWDRDGVTLTSTSVACTPAAKPVTATRRVVTVAGDTLHYELAMAAVGIPLTRHLSATLHRVG